MRITFLGTSSGTPTRTRNVTSIALQLPQRAGLWLFDCGEGTQHQFLLSNLRLSQLDKIFFTHLHGDHLFGLVGLLASRSLRGGEIPAVTLYGPTGLKEYVESTLHYSYTHLGHDIEVQTVKPGIIFEDEEFIVSCLPLKHRVESYGFTITEREQTGRFLVEKARELGITPGPLYGKLKNGELVTLPDGRLIDGKELVGPPRRGRKIVYCSDTIYCQNAIELARGADVLIHEATYTATDEELAVRGQHSTALMAAKVAREAGVKTLIITHFSPRYEADEGNGLNVMLQEARSIFPDTFMAEDFWSYEVIRPDI
jgi:ribonuclease Z